MNDPLTILMTCGSGPGVVGHIDAARNNCHAPVRMIVGDVRAEESAGLALADAFVRIPMADDPDFVNSLIALCKRHHVDVVWSVFDGELEPLADARHRFEAEGIRLLLASRDTIRLCLDKATFHQRLADSDWVLPSRVVRTVDELRSALELFGYPDRCVAIRPVYGTGGRGFHVVDAAHDGRDAFFAERPDSTTCNADDVARVMVACDDAVLVTPFIGGIEYGCDALASDGDVVAAVTRKKLPPIRDGMHLRILVDENPDVLEFVRPVVAEIKADGLLSIDLREDQDGRMYVLEINPRAGAYLGMACARIDLFGLALARTLGKRPEVNACRRTARPILGLRHWTDQVLVDDQWRALALPGNNSARRPNVVSSSEEKP
ncbi:MAG: ATP-grasp domain-containing protein [Phycisphaerae bacterium]|nr:ATP-grasp domain-containing protein [Phycisphaerae bacterium]